VSTSTSRSPKAPFLKRDGAFGGIMALVGHRKPAAVMVTRTAGTAIANVVAAAFTRLTQDGWGSAAATTALTTPMSTATVTSNSRTAMSLFTDVSPVAVVRAYGL
jgi:hypothetical protein